MTILKMTLEQAIQHAKNQADALAGTPCGEQHAQLSGWLTELLAVREAQSVPVAWQQRFSGDHWQSCNKSMFDYLSENPDPIVEVREVYAAPPALPANVIGRPATPDDSPYPATIPGGCLLAQAWADGYNVRNAVTAAPAPAVPAAIEPTYEAIKAILPTANPDEYACCVGADMWNACRAAMLQSCDTVRDLSTPVDPQIAEYEQNVLRLSGNSEHVGQGYTFDGLNIRAVAALRESVRNQWLKSEEFADKIYWKNMHSIANEIIEAMAAAPTPTK